MTVTNNKRHYWGIVDNGETVETGTYKDMWKSYMSRYANETVKSLIERDCKITRIS